MSPTRVLIYQEADGSCPFLDWFFALQSARPAFAKCIAAVNKLQKYGHDLERPASAPLEYGIHELRWRVDTVRYRVLYFFDGTGVAVLSHGITKKTGEVPPAEIKRAVDRMKTMQKDRSVHVITWEEMVRRLMERRHHEQ